MSSILDPLHPSLPCPLLPTLFYPRLHSSRTNPPAQLARLACETCHARKVRCDAAEHGLPCSNCRSQGKTDCRFHVREKRGSRPVRKTLANILPRPEAPLGLGPDHGRSSSLGETPSSDSNATATHVSPSDAAAARAIASTTTTTTMTTMTMTTTAAAAAPDDRTEEPADSYLADFIDQEDIEGSQITYRKRLYYIGSESSNLNFLVRQRQQQHRDLAVHHFASRQLPPKYTAHERDRVPADSFVLPERGLADQLIHAYFAHINPGFPVVDEDQFLKRYSGVFPDYPASLTLTQAILLVGAHVSQPLPERDQLKRTFFRRAKTLLDARYEQDRTVQVQCALLLTWHSDGAEDIGANAWYWVGYAARIAMGLGMHRDATRSTLHLVNKRVWQRVWWLLFQCDVVVSLSYGRPPAIRLEDTDIRFLEPHDFQGITKPHVEYFTQHAQLCIIMSDASRAVFGLRTTVDERRAAVLTADRALANWSLQLPSLMQSSHASFRAAMLHLTYNHFLILLHRPRPGQPVEPAHAVHDANICSNAALKIGQIFEHLVASATVASVWLTGSQALFTAIIQVSVEVRVSNAVLAQNAQARFHSILASLRALAEYWLNAAVVLRIFESRGLPGVPGQGKEGGGGGGARVKGRLGPNVDVDAGEKAQETAAATASASAVRDVTVSKRAAAHEQQHPIDLDLGDPTVPSYGFRAAPAAGPAGGGVASTSTSTSMSASISTPPGSGTGSGSGTGTGPGTGPDSGSGPFDRPTSASHHHHQQPTDVTWQSLFSPQDQSTSATHTNPVFADALPELQELYWSDLPDFDPLFTEDLNGHWFGDL